MDKASKKRPIYLGSILSHNIMHLRVKINKGRLDYHKANSASEALAIWASHAMELSEWSSRL